MDDALEAPSSVPVDLIGDEKLDGEHFSEDEEEGGLDWTKIPYIRHLLQLKHYSYSLSQIRFVCAPSNTKARRESIRAKIWI